jgi:chromosome segregation ATPase
MAVYLYSYISAPLNDTLTPLPVTGVTPAVGPEGRQPEPVGTGTGAVVAPKPDLPRTTTLPGPGGAGPAGLSVEQVYQEQVARANEKIEALQTETKTLKDAIKYAQDQSEELDIELGKRNQQIKELGQQIKDHLSRTQQLEKEKSDAQTAFEKREKDLQDDLKQVNEELASVKSALAENRIRLADINEKLALKERQYQSEVADLQATIKKRETAEKELLAAIEDQKAQVLALQEELSETRKERAEHYLEQARSHIVKTAERGSATQEHLEQALQQLYCAGRVDPENRLKYRQMAAELIDEQIERLKKERGDKAESDKRMKYFLELRSGLGGV